MDRPDQLGCVTRQRELNSIYFELHNLNIIINAKQISKLISD
jgi:hypothetical protein